MTHIEETSETSVRTCGRGDSPHENLELYDPIMSNDARRVLEIIFVAAINCVLSGTGSAANVINIIVFVKQGFNDSVNISLCGLAVSDLGANLTLLCKCISFNPLFRYSNIDFDSIQYQRITAAWPHSFVCMNNWITSLITLERCICVALPMKVKDIITPNRTLISVAAIFVTFSTIIYPLPWFIHRVSSFDTGRNKTLFGLSYAGNGLVYERVFFFVNICSQISSVFIVTFCTAILIHNLQSKSQWRQRATAVSCSGHTDSLSSRDVKVVKMVTFISCVFIVSYFPIAMNGILMINLSPHYGHEGRYHNIYHVTWAILNTLEVTNNSNTILIYYNMSSKFRASFNELFGIRHGKRHIVCCAHIGTAPSQKYDI